MEEIAVPIMLEDLYRFKKEKKKITMLSVPDFYTAQLADELGIHCILIGDSLGKHLQGEDDVFSVTIGDIVYYTKIVRRAVKNAFVIADMPYSSYEIGVSEAIQNARYLIEVGKADAVKLEGGTDYFPVIQGICKEGIKIFGHLGLKDSFRGVLGGYPMDLNQKTQDWDKILADAKKLEEFGICALLLECVPAELGKIVTQTLKIPVIGLGAGHHVDGHSMIFHDMMGYYEGHKLKYVKRYARLSQVMSSAVRNFVEDVQSLRFPSEEHEY